MNPDAGVVTTGTRMLRGASEGEGMSGRRETERRRLIPDNRAGVNYGYRRHRKGYYVLRPRRWPWVLLTAALLAGAALLLRGGWTW